MKRLITEAGMQEYAKTGATVFLVDAAVLLTPSAIDCARQKGIKLVYSCDEAACCGKQESCGEGAGATLPQSANPQQSCSCAEVHATYEIDKETITAAVIAVLKEKGLI